MGTNLLPARKDLGVLREYLDTMLASGQICSSKSPASASILFVLKKESRGQCFCVDYWGLNKVLILNQYPLSLMNELCNHVGGSTMLIMLDHQSG